MSCPPRPNEAATPFLRSSRAALPAAATFVSTDALHPATRPPQYGVKRRRTRTRRKEKGGCILRLLRGCPRLYRAVSALDGTVFLSSTRTVIHPALQAVKRNRGPLQAHLGLSLDRRLSLGLLGPSLVQPPHEAKLSARPRCDRERQRHTHTDTPRRCRRITKGQCVNGKPPPPSRTCRRR